MLMTAPPGYSPWSMNRQEMGTARTHPGAQSLPELGYSASSYAPPSSFSMPSSATAPSSSTPPSSFMTPASVGANPNPNPQAQAQIQQFVDALRGGVR